MKDLAWVEDWEQWRITRQQAKECAWRDLSDGFSAEVLLVGCIERQIDKSGPER